MSVKLLKTSKNNYYDIINENEVVGWIFYEVKNNGILINSINLNPPST